VLHALNWVCGIGRRCEVQGRIDGTLGHSIQDSFWAHSFDGERDFIKLKVTRKNHSSDLLDKIFHSTSIFIKYFLVVKGESAIFVHITWSEVVTLSEDLEITGQLNEFPLSCHADNARGFKRANFALLLRIRQSKRSIRFDHLTDVLLTAIGLLLLSFFAVFKLEFAKILDCVIKLTVTVVYEDGSYKVCHAFSFYLREVVCRNNLDRIILCL
jgi:hypothetical protein